MSWPARWAPPLLYFAVAVVMTWPLAAHLATHIPGTAGDGPNFLWRLWWVPHALFARGTSPWETDLLFHPQGAHLVFDTLAPLYGIASYPLQAALGVVAAYNLLLIGSLALAAWGVYLLALHVTGSRAGAFVAGLVFGYSPYLLVHLWGHLNLVAAWPLPYFALCVSRTIESGSPRWGLGAGVSLAAASLLDYQYGAFALFWALLAAAWCFRTRNVAQAPSPAEALPPVAQAPSPAGVQPHVAQAPSPAGSIFRPPGGYRAMAWRPIRLRPWLIAAAAWLALVSPLLFPALNAVASGADPTPGNHGDATYFSADLTGFFIPAAIRWGTERPPLFQGPRFQGVGGVEGVTYLGWAALALAAFGAFRARDRAPRRSGRSSVAARTKPAPSCLPAPFRAANVGQAPSPAGECGAGALACRPHQRRFWLQRQARQTRNPRKSGLGPAFWALVLAVFALLSLGPWLHVAGEETAVPLPYLLLQPFPYLGATRIPARFVVMAYCGLAVLAAIGLKGLLSLLPPGRPLARAAVTGAVSVLVLVDFGVAPLPLRAATVPDFYRTLASEPGDFALLPLPVLLEAGPRAGSIGRGDQWPQFYQTAHGRPLVHGHVARGSPEMLDFYARQPVLRWLLNPDAGPPAPADLDPAAFSAMVNDLRLRYAVLDKAAYDEAALETLREYFGGVFGQETAWEDAQVLAFRLGQARETGERARFLDRFRSGVTLVGPTPGSAVDGLRPLLGWEPDDTASLFEVQLSRDQWFGRSFLYHERIDGTLTDPPFSYRVPERYPLQPSAAYHWRVRRVVGDTPGPWTPTWHFTTPRQP